MIPLGQPRSHSSIDKALRLLLALSEEGKELGPTELSRKLGIHKATVSRILLQLKERNFVYRNDDNGKFWLGLATHHLGESFSHAFFNKIVPIAKLRADALRDELQYTISLQIWSGSSAAEAYIAKAEPERDAAFETTPILPLNAAAGALAILAFMDPSRAEQLLSETVGSGPPGAAIDKDALKDALVEDLGEIRKQGYAVDRERVFPGINAIAVPIFDRLKQPVAALVVLVPTRFFGAISTSKYATRLSAAARAIEREVSLRT